MNYMRTTEQYTLLGIIRVIWFVILTKLLFRPARLIRFPFDIRGKKYVRWGCGFTTGSSCRIEAYPAIGRKFVIEFGSNVQINDYVHITAMESVKIGNNVLMASKIYISDCTHGNYSGVDDHSSPEVPPIKRSYVCKPVVIEDNVWIGESVSILPGITIGRGCVIGANSIVTKNIPPYVIAVGTPAKPIKQYNFETEKWENFKK
jgi:lipopolysaccharide O-acetyltransferase